MRVAKRYGSNPLHLLGHFAAFAIAAYALDQILSGGGWVNFLFWFGGAAVLHDIVVLPLYSVVDRLPRRAPRPLINYVRVPALISGVLLLIYFPLILGPSDTEYFKATGHHPTGYLRNWLLITLALFLASGAVYGFRRLRR